MRGGKNAQVYSDTMVNTASEPSLKLYSSKGYHRTVTEGHGVVKLVAEVSDKDPLSYYSAVTNVTSEPSLKVRVTVAPVMVTPLPDPV